MTYNISTESINYNFYKDIDIKVVDYFNNFNYIQTVPDFIEITEKTDIDFNDDEKKIIDVIVDNVDDLIDADEDIKKYTLLSYRHISLKDLLLFFKVTSINKIIVTDNSTNKVKTISLKKVIKEIIREIKYDLNYYVKKHIINIHNSIHNNLNADLISYVFDESEIQFDLKCYHNDNLFDIIRNIDDIKRFQDLLNNDNPKYFYYDNQYCLLHSFIVDEIPDVDVFDDIYYDDIFRYIEDIDIDDLYNFIDDLIYEIKDIEDEIPDEDVLLYY